MSIQVLISVLTQIGLSDSGARLYELLIQLKKPTISDLAIKMGKTRKQIYQLLAELETHQLLEDRIDYQRGITATSPNHLMALVKNREAQLVRDTDRLKKILPDLLQAYGSIHQNPSVKTYTTLNEIRTFYLQITNEARGEIITLGNLDFFHDLIGENYLEYYIKIRKKNKVLARSLVFKTHIARKYQPKDFESNRIIRYLPEDSPPKEGCFGVHNDTVSIWDPILPKVVTIQDSILAELFRFSFELLWKTCSE